MVDFGCSRGAPLWNPPKISIATEVTTREDLQEAGALPRTYWGTNSTPKTSYLLEGWANYLAMVLSNQTYNN